MQNKKHKITKRILSIVALVALVLGNIGAVSSVYAADPVTVTIVKHIDGEMATAESANSSDFPMSATWAADNIGPGTGEYTLSENGAPEYQAKTTEMDNGADYSTNEILTSDIVGANCTATTTQFALTGYTTGDTYAEAASSTPTMTIPAFTNMQNDKYVIVWNQDCEVSRGEIEGNVEGSNGTLAVTSIDSVDTTATADGTFTNGWRYVFHITAPSNEQDLAMKFSNWLRNGGGGTIPVASNMRISSAQADNGGATVLLIAADTYSSPTLHMTGDLSTTTVGRQVEVVVEVAIPNGTPDGSYSTNYGVQTNP